MSAMSPRLHAAVAAALLAFLALPAPPALSAPLGAQAAPRSDGTPPLTVAAAVALAMARHPALVAAAARRRLEVGVVRQQAAFANPVVEWRRENIRSPLAPDEFFTVSQPVDLSGRRLALRREARAVDARAVADSTAVARAVATEAARAFWHAALSRALLDLAVEHRADAACLADVEAARAREGAVSGLAAMRTAVESERARLAEATARAGWVHATAALARALGVAPDELPPVAPLPLSTTDGAAVPERDAAVASALARRPDVTALRAAVVAARHRRDAARRATMPDVALQGGAKRTAGYTTAVVGVLVPLPLLDRNAGGRAYADGALQLAEAELEIAEQAVRAEVTAAVDALRALAGAATPRADSLAAHAAEVARIADAAYAAGGGSLLELLETRRARAESMTAALRASADRRLAWLELDRALGTPPSYSPEVP